MPDRLKSILADTRSRLSARAESLKRFARNEITILKAAANDIRERFDLDEQTEPVYTRDLGGTLGTRGSVLKVVPAVVIDTVDNILELIQTQASINRRVFRR